MKTEYCQTQEVQQKQLPPLERQQSTYKMIVPRKVEEKIRYMLRKYPSTEWSGVLFISRNGTFEDNNLVITCEDIYPMDLGNATFTSFKMNEDVASYMANNIELFDCDMGLAHSHHGMSTNFSGTDIETLRDEGNDRNCFVSLIVNNAGIYSAAITRKIQSKVEVTVKNLNKSYEFFGDGPVEIERSDAPAVTETINKEVIQYFMLDVEREELENPLSYIDDRFDEIQHSKCDRQPLSSSWFSEDTEVGEHKSFSWLPKKSDNAKQLTFWEEENKTVMEREKQYKVNEFTIHSMAVRLITCSLVIDTSKINLKQWITTHMFEKYQKIFTSDNSFSSWCDFAVEYLIEEYYVSDECNDNYLKYNDVAACVAEALIEELSNYPSNLYIEEYVNTLEQFL